MNDYEYAKLIVEDMIGEAFESDFPKVTGRTVEIIDAADPPDLIARIDGIVTGVELTAIHAASADHIVAEMYRLAGQKHEKYTRAGLFSDQPIILLGHLTWPAMGTRERENLTPEVLDRAMATYPALWDVWREVEDMHGPSDFAEFGFSEIWLMDDGMKYTSRRHPGHPADFFCFAPFEQGGFWQRERKRALPYSLLYAGF